MSGRRHSGGPQSWRLVTAVWGRRFVERFLTSTLPSILAPRNLPALADGEEVEYRIFTRAADIPHIEASPLFSKLAAFVAVRFETIDSVVASAKYDRLAQIHRLGLEGTAEADIGVVFLTPDAVWANGTLAAVRTVALAGYDAAVMDGPRVVRGPFAAEISSRFGANEILSIAPRELMEMSVRHIHSNESAWHWGSDWLHDAPFQLHWPVPGEGMVTRGFCLFPIYVRLRRPIGDFVGAIDRGLLDAAFDDRSGIYYCGDSDIMAVVSIDDLGFSSASIKRTDKHDRILRIAKWALATATEQNLDAVRHPARRHFSEMSEKTWRRVERLSAAHIEAVLGCREILLLHRVLSERGLSAAAGILAFGLHQRGLARRAGTAGNRTFLVPIDPMAERFSFVSLLAPDRVRAFHTELRRWVLPERCSADAAIRTRPDLRIVDRDIPIGSSILHVVDRASA